MFTNDTQHPRAEALATSAMTDALTLDGTYKIRSAATADAVLVGKIKRIKYAAIRSSRLDSLLPEELSNSVIIIWNLKDARNPTKLLATGVAEGKSQLFVDSNLQTARNNALPDAFERAAESITSSLANGY